MQRGCDGAVTAVEAARLARRPPVRPCHQRALGVVALPQPRVLDLLESQQHRQRARAGADDCEGRRALRADGCLLLLLLLTRRETRQADAQRDHAFGRGGRKLRVAWTRGDVAVCDRGDLSACFL